MPPVGAHGFDTLNLNRIALDVYESNLRAVRSYEKVGFVHEGCKRQAIYKDGKYADILQMQRAQTRNGKASNDICRKLLRLRPFVEFSGKATIPARAYLYLIRVPRYLCQRHTRQLRVWRTSRGRCQVNRSSISTGADKFVVLTLTKIPMLIHLRDERGFVSRNRDIAPACITVSLINFQNGYLPGISTTLRKFG